MDLTDMLKEASIIDHSWYKDGMLKPGAPTFEPVAEGMKKHNNIKPELEVEWGGATTPDIDLNQPAGIVQRNLPDDAIGDASAVIVFARDAMNRGVMGRALVAALKGKFASKTLRAAKDGLRKQLALEGVVGCIAVDGRGYESCRDALKAASHSPYKYFLKYVIGCQCGEPHSIASLGQRMAVKAETIGGSVDAFFASTDEKHVPTMASHCRSTMMPILAARGDLDPSDMDTTMIDMMNMSGLPEGQYKQIWDDRKNNKYSSNLEAIRAAFRWLNHRKESAESSRYAGKVKAYGISMGMGDTPVDISAPLSPTPDVEMGQNVLDNPPMLNEPVAEAAPQAEFDDLMEDILVDAAPPAPLGISMVQEEMPV
jgi:hypothetical protein